MFFQDLDDRFPSKGFEVDVIGRDLIGHDGGWVRIDQGDFDTFLFEGASGLASGIVKFAGLSDDDGTGADDEYGAKGVVFRHRAGNESSTR